jgi:putative lipoic acid-binding regulatory protein
MNDQIQNNKMNERLWKLRLVLEETVEFPSEYLFKFIVPKSEVHHVLALLDGMDIEERASANGNYISVSARKICNASDDIIQVYKKVSTIKGLIAL